VDNSEPKSVSLQKRFTAFAAGIIGLTSQLPQTTQARHIAAQLLRSGTSVASNYAEARGAESRSDFLHKLRVVLKELNETEVWLDLTVLSSLVLSARAQPVLTEARELSKIIAKSIRTAGGFQRDK